MNPPVLESAVDICSSVRRSGRVWSLRPPASPRARGCMGEWRLGRTGGWTRCGDRMTARVTQGGACVLSVSPAWMLRCPHTSVCGPGLRLRPPASNPMSVANPASAELAGAWWSKPSRGGRSPRTEGAEWGSLGATGHRATHTLEGHQTSGEADRKTHLPGFGQGLPPDSELRSLADPRLGQRSPRSRGLWGAAQGQGRRRLAATTVCENLRAQRSARQGRRGRAQPIRL